MIKEILEHLKPEQRQLLMIAFEGQFSQYVEYSTGLFIGVNVDMLPNLEITETAGVWSTGKLRPKDG